MFNFKNSNSGKIRVKLLATLLVLTLTFANFALVGSYIGEAIATEIDLTNQDNSTNNNDNVKFELYFDATNKNNQISKDINSENLVLYALVSVQNGGILENAKLNLTDTNFELKESSDEQNLVIGTLKAGEEKTVELPIQVKKDGSTFNLGLLDMISKITLTGNYTNEDDVININTEKYVQVNWTSEEIESIPEEEPKPIELSQELITNKVYKLGETDKRVIQYKISSGITDNRYPIKSTAIELQAPKYDATTKEMLKAEQIVEGVNWVAPEQVVVTAYSLDASNPNEILNFKQYDETAQNNAYYVYNQSEGKVNINVTNKENENNEIVWSEGKDEFIATYIYPVDVEVTAIESIVDSKIELYDLNNRTLSKEITNTQTIREDFGNVITFETDANSSIYKSNMYIDQETVYSTKWTAKISCTDIAESIKIVEVSEKLKTAEDQEVESKSYYKNTYINKQELDYILGEQGNLKIYDYSNSEEPKLLNEINISTEASEDGVITIENGIITIKYPQPADEVTGIETILIEIINPANVGLLNIYNQKSIKPNDIEEVSSIEKLDISTKLFAVQGENEIVNLQKTNTIKLEEPVSGAEFGVSKTEFSTLQENDVNFTVTLKTDNLKYDLYEAPVVTIALPEIVKDIKVTEEDITILNSDVIKLESLNIDNENNQIKLTLSGEQTGYNSTNTQISVNAKITTEKLIPTTMQNIVMTLVNGKETVYPNNQEAIIKTQAVNFEAESGILLATSVSNYNSENKTITAFEENVAGILEVEKEAEIATVTGTVINNTKTDLEEIKVLGKVQNSSTSINTALNTQIEVTKTFGENPNLETVVYYTEDTNPSLESNWVNTPNENTTAYLVVCKNLSKATAIKFTYKIAIPENLDTNKNTEINYEVYANNETYVAPVVNLQTPKEVKLALELTANVQNGQEVYEDQNVMYNIKVTNVGEVDAENVKINVTSAGLNIIEGQTTIDGLNIKAGESVDKQIKAIVNKNTTEINLTAQATTDYLMTEAKGTIVNTVSKAGIELEINNSIFTFSVEDEIAQIGSRINYQLNITNTLNEDLNNILVLDNLPEELKFDELYVYKINGEEITTLDLTQIENSYNEGTKELKVKIDNLKPGEKILISIYAKVEKVVDSNIKHTLYVGANEKYPDVTFSITDTTAVRGLPQITSSVTSNAEENINAGDIIEYIIKVKNEGETPEAITIESIIPEQLEIQNAYYYYVEGEQHEVLANLNNINVYSMELKQNQEITLIITAKATEIMTDTEVESKVTITGIYMEETTEKIENTVIGTGEDPNENPGENPEDNPNQNPGNNPSDNPNENLGNNPSDDPNQNPDGDSNDNQEENPGDDSNNNPNEGNGNQDENQESTYSISGVAWQDDNKNGARENEEKLLSDIVVKIINANTNEFLVDENGNQIQQITNENGIYEFSNLKVGKYIVIFEYNNTTYSLTTYQKSGVEGTINSDARLVTEENNNVVKTDIIEIKNENVSNIDIGLITNPIFDLKLDKYITKATVQNSRGTEIYEYDKTQMAKVEIPAKALEGSLIIVEYQIDVTNEGDIPAHVDTIVDYVSPQFEFKSELNTTWYQGKDNNLYCIEFANEDLKPGETVSAKLVLTKTMTNENTGLVNNAAEIYETFNEYAFNDIDSTPANKGEEDDLSQADIIISIKTGGPLLYIGIIIISMAILSVGIYLINKKVIKNHIM